MWRSYHWATFLPHFLKILPEAQTLHFATSSPFCVGGGFGHQLCPFSGFYKRLSWIGPCRRLRNVVGHFLQIEGGGGCNHSSAYVGDKLSYPSSISLASGDIIDY